MGERVCARYHSTGSQFLGYDEYGHEQFDTKRTEIGELLYRVKYKRDDAALDELVSIMAELKLPAASCRESSKGKEVKRHDFHVARLPRSKLRGMRSQCPFMNSKRLAVDMIVPVPPTRMRKVQPLFKIADALGVKVKTPVVRNAVKKTGGSELKNLHSYEKRRQALEHVITADSKLVTGKRILLLDDLVRSGATINAVAEQLTSAGATVVHVLAITQTRRQ